MKEKYPVLIIHKCFFASVAVLAERGGERQWAEDPSSTGEDPPAEGDQTGAAHRPRRSVQQHRFWNRTLALKITAALNDEDK